jgi:hypothetical protein
MLCSFQVHYYDNLSQVGSLLENDLFLILLQLSWLYRDRVVVAFQIAVSFERIFNLTIRGAHSAELEVLKLALTNYLISLLFFATKPEWHDIGRHDIDFSLIFLLLSSLLLDRSGRICVAFCSYIFCCLWRGLIITWDSIHM